MLPSKDIDECEVLTEQLAQVASELRQLASEDSSDALAPSENTPRWRIREAVDPTQLTTFGLGVAQPLVIEPADLTSLSYLLGLLDRSRVPWRVIGAGSNLILPDTPIEAVLIRFGRSFAGYHSLPLEDDAPTLSSLFAAGTATSDLTPPAEASVVRLLVGAGAPLMGLSRRTAHAGLSGLEFAAGIPGTLGGAVKMNAGAHGHALSEIVRAAHVMDVDGTCSRLDASELAFGYRRSNIADDQLVVAAELELKRASIADIQHERTRCLEYRRSTQPLSAPSAGSVFRNPIAKPGESETQAAAALLEQVGVKGLVRGTVQYSELHSNWLVRAAPQGRAEDAHELIRMGQERVLDRFGIKLVPEIILW
ncbi:MAG: UDP-N-acetylmuramate dehydrogenase [Bdellovibrionales bacterium]|nr:UDP-N-acetylmuramate dehydrogenase [Bdellovibrionales bacterium]